MSTHGLYHQTLLDHGKAPRNHAPLPEATHTGTADNPLCGDRVRVELALDGDRIREARFTIKGCLLATASASLMTEAVVGRSPARVVALWALIEAACASGRPAPRADSALAGDQAALAALGALVAVREYPARRRCATLPWVALGRALEPPTRDEV